MPIPGFKTKNTISLRLWEAKARAEDLDLFQFNEGEYELAAQLHSRAQQVIYNFSSLRKLHLFLIAMSLFIYADLHSVISRRCYREWEAITAETAVLSLQCFASGLSIWL